MTTGFFMLGAFVSPGLLAAGVGAVCVPIIIHIISRRRFKRVRWAAIEFLLQAERRNRRRVRMDEWILLALRCLAVLMIALLIARPFARPNDSGAAWASSGRTERVFVLDDSFSMAYEWDGRSAMDRGKEAIRRLIDIVRVEAPDDTVSILRMSDPTHPVEFGTFLDETQTESLLARLTAIPVTQRSIDPAAVIEGVADVLRRGGGVSGAVVHLVSDFQRHDWADRPEADEKPLPSEESATTDAPPATQDILTPLAKWASEDHGLRLMMVNVGHEHAVNFAVTGLTLGEGSLIVGAPGKFTAELSNHADASAEHVSLDLTVGSSASPAKSIGEIGPHQVAAVELDVSFLHAGDEAVRVEVTRDALPLDDVRHAVAAIRNSMRVLLVNGEPADDLYRDEVALLSAALRPEGDVFSGNEVSIVDEVEIERTSLDGFDVVMLANVYRLSAVALESLEGYVRDGGGLMVFMGDQVNPDWYVGTFFREGEGLLPVEPIEIIRPSSVARLVVTDPLHPALRGLSREGDPLGIGQIGFFGFYACRPFVPTGADGDGRSATAKVPARVLCRFDDAGAHAAVIERSFGKGRVVVFTSTADREWNDWPGHPTYLPMLMEFVRYVARRGESREETLVGAAIELRVDPARYEPDAVLRTPGYPDEREVGVSAGPAGDGRGVVFRWERADVAGVYRFVLTRRDGGEETRMIAVNPDPAESDLTRASAIELRHAMPSVPFEYVEGVEALSSSGSQARSEYWPVMVVLAIALLMGEQGFAWWCGRRR